LLAVARTPNRGILLKYSFKSFDMVSSLEVMGSGLFHPVTDSILREEPVVSVAFVTILLQPVRPPLRFLQPAFVNSCK
jgi:hypothetical protein